MNRPYPFVSDLLFRAKHHSIDSLSTTPITQLWRIESLDPSTVMQQLGSHLEGPELSTPQKLKLGFLIGYSWPLHLHSKTEYLLLRAKTRIDARYPAESLLLWGNLASYYLRSHQVPQALQQLSQAFEWANHKAEATDLQPLLEWASLIFTRLNRPRESLRFANARLALSDDEQQTNFRQSCQYARAVSLMRTGDIDGSLSQLELLEQKISSGTAQLDIGNQAGVVHRLAQLHFVSADSKKTEHCIGLSKELNQLNMDTLLNARLKLQSYKLAACQNNKSKTSSLREELAHYQDSESSNLDVCLSQQITHIRQPKPTQRPIPTHTLASDTAVEEAIQQLHHRFGSCLRSLQLPIRQRLS